MFSFHFSGHDAVGCCVIRFDRSRALLDETVSVARRMGRVRRTDEMFLGDALLV